MTQATAKTGGRRRVPRWLAWLGVLLVMAVAAIAVALQVTPSQTVNVAGQVITVGATAPTLSLSGPGEIDLFGQSLPTNLHFVGPVRPRLQLAQITINSELTNFVRGAHPAGAARVLGNLLADGWIRYFAWETVICGLGALLLAGAVAGWRRLPRGTTIKLLVAGLVVTEAINLGAIMVTAYQAPGSLRQVHSLNQLVGSEPPVSDATKAAPLRPGVQVVVIGDSTAAGAGLPAVSHATRSDLACGRSTDSYAEDLARADNWNVLNLACDSATIARGLLGSQGRGGQTVPAQFDEMQRARSASVVIVSIGADDLGWSAMVQYCAVAPNCNDRASAAYFQQQLASFSKNYLQLLSQLATLPEHPRVLINRYYDPFGPNVSCLRQAGFTTAKLRTLTSRLNTLNAVLAKGADDFGFASTQPDFAGHQMCTQQPFVQGPQGTAPFHPTTLGQFAIALTDQAAMTFQAPLQR
jgi:lysophospholipase L1-like esterase